MKWYLISEETVEEIRNDLTLTDGQIRELDALHHLDSGLHTTNVVPSDYAVAEGIQAHICAHFDEPAHSPCSYCEAYSDCHFHNDDDAV